MLKASAGFTAAMLTSTQIETPLNGQTVTILQTNSGNIYVLLKPAAALLSLNVQLPPGLFNGQTITIAVSQGITALNLSGYAVVGALTSVASNGFSKYLWTAVDSTWTRVG